MWLQRRAFFCLVNLRHDNVRNKKYYNMAELNILQRGGDKKKFIITSRNPNLDMEACDFYVEQIYGQRQNKVVVQKSEMLYGTDGEHIMVLDTTKQRGGDIPFVWWAIDTDIHPTQTTADEEVDDRWWCS